jgi:AmiR/NasT family two-component response regulator
MIAAPLGAAIAECLGETHVIILGRVPDQAAMAGDARDPADEIADLRAALASRDAIGQAKGMIRLLTHGDADTAFELLCLLSQDTNRKLRDVAVVFAECASAGTPLPADLALSWRRRTEQQP